MDRGESFENAAENEATEYLPICSEILPERLLIRAKEELNETDENIKAGLKAMKDMIKKEGLSLEPDDDLLRFLRVKKYNFKASFEAFRQYVKAIDLCLKQLKIPDADTFCRIISKGICSVLPFRDSEDRAILVYKLGLYEKEGFAMEEAFVSLLGVSFCISMDPATQIGGIAFLVDAEHMILSDAPAIISYARWLIPLLKGFPGRLRRVDIINQSTFFGALVNIVRPFLPTKIKNRVKVHGRDMESLLRIYPASVLPTDYGGTLEPLNNECWKERIDIIHQCFKNSMQRYKKDSTT